MIDYNINDSFQTLLGEMYYKYKGYRAENLPNGNVLFILSEMTKEQFHKEVDLMHKFLERSIERALDKIKKPGD